MENGIGQARLTRRSDWLVSGKKNLLKPIILLLQVWRKKSSRLFAIFFRKFQEIKTLWKTLLPIINSKFDSQYHKLTTYLKSQVKLVDIKVLKICLYGISWLMIGSLKKNITSIQSKRALRTRLSIKCSHDYKARKKFLSDCPEWVVFSCFGK